MRSFDQLHTLVSARDAWPDVRVLCIWLPQLPLRVEVLRQPAWDGRPLVLGSAPGERKVVQLCSPEAAQAGLQPGLPLREVAALCPEAIVVPPDPVRVARVLDELVSNLQDTISPDVEALETGYVFLDLSGLKALYQGSLARLEAAVRAVVPPVLRPRLGAASGKFVAAVAAHSVTASPDRLRAVPARATERFLAPLPVAELPFDPDTVQRLQLLGLHQIGDLARLPFGAVQAQFGPVGARVWRLAHGQDEEPIVPRSVRLPVNASMRFDDPPASVESLLAALDVLLADVFASSLLAGRSVRQLRLRALLSDTTSWERTYTFKEALSSRDMARRALKAKLDLPNGLPPAPVEEVWLELRGLGGEVAKQASLFAAHAQQLGQIAEAARQLRARYGHIPLYQVLEVEPWSRIPERRWALVTCDL